VERESTKKERKVKKMKNWMKVVLVVLGLVADIALTTVATFSLDAVTMNWSEMAKWALGGVLMGLCLSFAGLMAWILQRD
jgi:fluoride ion exporter CrcB/FEX